MNRPHIFSSWVLAINYATHTAGHHTITTHSVSANTHLWEVTS